MRPDHCIRPVEELELASKRLVPGMLHNVFIRVLPSQTRNQLLMVSHHPLP